MTPFSTFSGNETIFSKVSSKAYKGEKMVLCTTKEASKSNSKRVAFFYSFCRWGECAGTKIQLEVSWDFRISSVCARRLVYRLKCHFCPKKIFFIVSTLPLNGQIKSKVTWIQSLFSEFAIALKVYFFASFLVLTFYKFDMLLVKFSFSEKATKICAIFLMVLMFTKEMSKPWGRLCKFLSPAQKIWTLPMGCEFKPHWRMYYFSSFSLNFTRWSVWNLLLPLPHPKLKYIMVPYVGLI